MPNRDVVPMPERAPPDADTTFDRLYEEISGANMPYSPQLPIE